jgi:hypothetical protein
MAYSAEVTTAPETSSAQSEPLTLFGYPVSPAAGRGLALLFSLPVAALVLLAGTLALRGGVTAPGGPLTQARLWLVREQGNQGVGFSSGRLVSGDLNGPRASVETRVRFFLWRAETPPQAVRFCECFVRIGGEWNPDGACAP